MQQKHLFSNTQKNNINNGSIRHQQYVIKKTPPKSYPIHYQNQSYNSSIQRQNNKKQKLNQPAQYFNNNNPNHHYNKYQNIINNHNTNNSNQSNSQNKYFKLLQSININTNNNYNNKFQLSVSQNHNKSYQQMYISKMKQYQSRQLTDKNATSIVDQIISTTQNSHYQKLSNFYTKNITHNKFVTKPTIVPLDNKIRNKILQINDFFNHHNSIQNQQNTIHQQLSNPINAYSTYKSQVSHQTSIINQKLDQIYIYNLQNYAQILQYLPPKTNKDNNKREKSSAANSRIQQLNKNSYKNLNAKDYNSQNQGQSPSPPSNKAATMRKIDIILIQILRQKKRKGLISDYFQVMEMKLVQLLQHIIEDQPQYQNPSWNLAQKMKQILRNLQSFKGKTIQGQSKVNLLRIFFEQFRNLKQQRQQKDAAKIKMTPKKTTMKNKDRKEQSYKKQIKNKNGNVNMNDDSSMIKDENRREGNLKARINYHETMSMGGQSKNKKGNGNLMNENSKIEKRNINSIKNENKVQTKSMKQDEWIGQL